MSELPKGFHKLESNSSTNVDITSMDFSSLIDGDHNSISRTEIQDVPTEEKKKRGRPKKEIPAGAIAVPSTRELGLMESNVPIINSYKENQEQLKNTVNAIDMMAVQIEQDIQSVRAARTLKRKYDYICELSSVAGSLMSNRISAIREINNTITNAHRLEMERNKQMKASEVAQDDDKMLMDMYRAYVNTPMGTIPNMPTIAVNQAALNTPTLGVPITAPNTVMTDSSEGFNAFINTPSPELAAVRMEQNPNIKVVVVYNQETHEKFFDAQDLATGQSIAGIPLPDPSLLDGVIPDIRNGIAYIRTRINLSNVTKYYVYYEDQAEPLIFDSIETYFNVTNNGTLEILLEGVDIDKIVDFEIKAFYVYCDIFSSETNGSVRSSSIGLRFSSSDVGMQDLIASNGEVLKDKTLNPYKVDLDLAMGLSVAGFVILYEAISIFTFFYLKNKNKDDEFKRMIPKQYFKTNTMGLLTLGILLVTIEAIAFRVSLMKNTLPIFNSLDIIIVIGGVASIILVGYFIRYFAIQFKNMRDAKRNEKLKLNKNTIDDGTLIITSPSKGE